MLSIAYHYFSVNIPGDFVAFKQYFCFCHQGAAAPCPGPETGYFFCRPPAPGYRCLPFPGLSFGRSRWRLIFYSHQVYRFPSPKNFDKVLTMLCFAQNIGFFLGNYPEFPGSCTVHSWHVNHLEIYLYYKLAKTQVDNNKTTVINRRWKPWM